MIKGIKVTLYEKKETGTDPFGHPVYEEMPVDVENVLVAPSATTEVLDVLNITGKKQCMTLQFPKVMIIRGKTAVLIFWRVMEGVWAAKARN